MAEGSTGTAVYGSRQLSITHSHSLKGRLQCSCPVSLCFAVPYFILSMLKHCSNASIAARTHSNHTHTRARHTMTHVLCTFWRIVDMMTYRFIRNEYNTYISSSLSQNSIKMKEKKCLSICKGSHRTNQTFYANKKKCTALR